MGPTSEQKNGLPPSTKAKMQPWTVSFLFPFVLMKFQVTADESYKIFRPTHWCWPETRCFVRFVTCGSHQCTTKNWTSPSSQNQNAALHVLFLFHCVVTKLWLTADESCEVFRHTKVLMVFANSCFCLWTTDQGQRFREVDKHRQALHWTGEPHTLLNNRC